MPTSIDKKLSIMNTPTARTMATQSYATMDVSPFHGDTGGKTEFEEQLNVNLDRYTDTQEAIQATLVDVGMGDMDAINVTKRIMGEMGEATDEYDGNDDWHRPERGVTNDAGDYYLGRSESNSPANPGNSLVKGDSYMGASVETQMAYAQAKETNFHGLTIKIEKPAGGMRKGTDPSGEEWLAKTFYPYGHIKGANGKDGEGLDCYVGPDPLNAEKVYIVRQNIPDTGKYDEDKVMLGFPSKEAARDAYLAHYDDQKFLGGMIEMSVREFITKIKAGTYDGQKLAQLKLSNKILQNKVDTLENNVDRINGMLFPRTTRIADQSNYSIYPFEGDEEADAAEEPSNVQKRCRDFVGRAKKRLKKRYERVPSGDGDKVMGRAPNTGGGGSFTGGTGWDTTGPSVGGTSGIDGGGTPPVGMGY